MEQNPVEDRALRPARAIDSRHILDSLRDVESFVGGMDFEDFANDRKTINAEVRSIEVIGEALKKHPALDTDPGPG